MHVLTYIALAVAYILSKVSRYHTVARGLTWKWIKMKQLDRC